tara:strand:- start:620 stop:817 length:198 start_codon:yes stop_codon:yes gene_type:complete
MSQLKTRDEMHEMTQKELRDYEHELYLVWQEARVISTYRKEMENAQILLNSTNVVNLLTNGEEEE